LYNNSNTRVVAQPLKPNEDGWRLAATGGRAKNLVQKGQIHFNKKIVQKIIKILKKYN
jgi:hypothetical protein